MGNLRPHLLIYDGDCGFCEFAVRLAVRFDRSAQFSYRPWQSLGAAEFDAFEITPDDCASAVRIVTADGEVLSGAEAVNYFLGRRPVGRFVVGMLESVPLLLVLEARIYRLIADNRRKISWLFGLRACRIPTQGSRPPDAMATPDPME